MRREFVLALRAGLSTFVLCAVAYPTIVWGCAQLFFPWHAEGSLLYAEDRSIIGSRLIAQRFQSDRYFHPRPSAVHYNAEAAGASNLGANNPDLRKAIAERVRQLEGTRERPIPVDLVTASGSGLDPDISLAGALYQAPRIAAARGRSIEEVRALIAQHTDDSGRILGAPSRINVLELNLALDKLP
jgi:potassium-transporting ATPase KdpC subunit